MDFEILKRIYSEHNGFKLNLKNKVLFCVAIFVKCCYPRFLQKSIWEVYLKFINNEKIKRTIKKALGIKR